MKHTFIHIGDVHLCSTHPRNADRIASIKAIAEAGMRHSNLAGWLIPGDLFHQRSTAEDRTTWAIWLQAMAASAPVFLTRGNHDGEGELDIFTRLETNRPILLANTPQVLTARTPTGAVVACFALPYPFKSQLVSAGVEHSQLGQVARDAFDPIFIAAADELRDAAESGAIPLMIAHVNIGGAISSSAQPQIGVELELDPALLSRLGPIAKACNHIHRHQAIYGAVYAGSTTRHDFGENEEGKGFVEWTFDDDTREWSWRFVALNVPGQIDVAGELTRDAFIPDAPLPDVAGSDCRCRYRFLKADAGVIDVEHIKKLFAGCRSLKLEGLPQLTHEMRAPEIAAAVTIEEKVAKYCELHKIVATKGLREKLMALQLATPETVCSIVTQHLERTGATAPAETVGA